ncbi:uncharacterized protein LODBEIA_P50230 [Lodderomyces beijingensis]|uniref:Uncharacterized protein n=1 Tax=Lodderomyces beijingensis TaxID=1775926 RepID=A0ABP0ZRM5_9ASCO
MSLLLHSGVAAYNQETFELGSPASENQQRYLKYRAKWYKIKQKIKVRFKVKVKRRNNSVRRSSSSSNSSISNSNINSGKPVVLSRRSSVRSNFRSSIFTKSDDDDESDVSTIRTIVVNDVYDLKSALASGYYPSKTTTRLSLDDLEDSSTVFNGNSISIFRRGSLVFDEEALSDLDENLEDDLDSEIIYDKRAVSSWKVDDFSLSRTPPPPQYRPSLKREQKYHAPQPLAHTPSPPFKFKSQLNCYLASVEESAEEEAAIKGVPYTCLRTYSQKLNRRHSNYQLVNEQGSCTNFHRLQLELDNSSKLVNGLHHQWQVIEFLICFLAVWEMFQFFYYY